jgi:diguanylate cyclase (GGDEF)-like protein
MIPRKKCKITNGTKQPSGLDERIQILEKELLYREQEITLLKETSDAITSQFNLEKLFQLVGEHARKLIQAETLLIPILDEACSTYTYRAGCGKNVEEIVGESLPLELGVCGWVWRNKRPWWSGVLDELDEDERNKWEHEAGSLILVPLIGKHHFLGGIAGINKIDGNNFDKRDLDLLSMFASQVSIAIENATFFEKIDSAKKEAETYQIDLQALNARLTNINEELEHLALYDSLTGLPNRSLIKDRLKQGIKNANRDNKPMAIMMIDLDRFKDVNDTLGHNTGDELLKEVGARFNVALRTADTVGRLGGDEFAVIIPGANVRKAVNVAKNIMKTFELPFTLEENHFSVSASMGIAVYPDHGQDMSTLMKHADVAMYVAKRTKNGYFVYNSEEDKYSPTRLALSGDLRSAMNADEFQLYYQPKMDLSSGRIIGVEALARWLHPQRGFIPPDDFIPVLEQTGLIKQFTLWVLDTALNQHSLWIDAGMDLTMAINLSMYNLRDPLLPNQITDILKKWNTRKGSLIMELTEGSIMDEPINVQRILTQLEALGIQFSIDDFGTGYSSLSHLNQLKVSELKIDRSFVMNMGTNKDSTVIVHSIIDLAHNLGLRVVAEGVEDSETLAHLKESNCDIIQGNHISIPLPAEDLVTFFEKTNSQQVLP